METINTYSIPGYETFDDEKNYQSPERTDKETQYKINRHQSQKIGSNALKFMATVGAAA